MNVLAGIFVAAVLPYLFTNSERNYINRPVVGILTQELSSKFASHFPGYKSYIAGSYVKALQASGARVVPIMIGQDEEYYRQMVNEVNGVLYPGGNSNFYSQGGYAEAGGIIYKLAIEVNNAGDYFPLSGICLGLLFFMHISNNKHSLQTDCYSVDDVLPLEFKPDFRNSHLFKNASEYVINILESEPVTYNMHTGCITETNITRFGLDKLWKVLSFNKDLNGLEFVSSVEMKDYPIFALQFHPEKNAYEWKNELNIPHMFNALYSARYFYDYFVNQTRHNNHTYPEEFLDKDLIDNYIPTFTGTHKDIDFYQMYLFK